MEFEFSLPQSQKPSTCLFLSQFNPYITKRLFKVSCNLISDGTQKHKKTFPQNRALLARSRH